MNSCLHCHRLLYLHMFFPLQLDWRLPIWLKLQKMDPTEKQLADMLNELKSRSKEQVILESVSFGFLSLLMLVGNFLTLLVMLLNRRLRTIPNVFVASLAVSDFFIGAVTSGPLGIPVLLTSQWPFSDTTCQFQGYIVIALAVASVHTLALMAVNRYFRIVKASKYRRYFTKKKTMIMILLSWFYSMCCPLPYFLAGHKMVFHASKFFCYPPINNPVFLAYGVPLYIGIPTSIIFYCYLKIFKTVRSHNNNFHLPGNQASMANVEEIKVARTLFVIVVFFNLCWTPVFLIDIVDTILGRWTFPREVYVAYTFLANISSALNPFIYGVLNKNFRKDYLKLLCCRYCRCQTVVRPLTLEGGSNVMNMGPTLYKKENAN